MSKWTLAPSLVTLLREIDTLCPGRSKASDGTIGDAAHQKQGSSSQHNPMLLPGFNGVGVVRALDITHDVKHCNGEWLFQQLVRSNDRRLRYVIWQKRFWAPGNPVVGYLGAPHMNHVHISVTVHTVKDVRSWNLKLLTPITKGNDMGTLDGTDPYGASQAIQLREAAAALMDGWKGVPGHENPNGVVARLERVENTQKQILEILQRIASSPVHAN